MPDVKELYEMVTKQVPPRHDPLADQLARQARVARTRKTAAIVASAALIATVVAVGVFALTRSDEATPGGSPSPARTESQSPATAATSPLGPQILWIDGSVVGTIDADLAIDETLRVSPDGQTIAFYGVDGISSIGIDGTGERVLVGGVADGGDAQHNLSWSPDGSMIAYGWHDDVWVMEADGSNQQRLTTAPDGFGNYYPAWSPDGSTIAYWHGRSTGQDGGPPDAEIYSIPATGGEPTRLTHDDVSSIEPAWSPDARQIVYRTADPAGLVVMNADGTEARVVTRDGVNPWAPVWSPDGRQIAYLACCANYRSVTNGPLLRVEILGTAENVTRLDVRVEHDANGPVWLSNDTLLVNRYD